MIREVTTRIAPTERSMPAVRITSVCATAMMPTTVTCCSTVESAPGPRNRGAISPKARMLITSTSVGMVVGLARRKVCTMR